MKVLIMLCTMSFCILIDCGLLSVFHTRGPHIISIKNIIKSIKGHGLKRATYQYIIVCDIFIYLFLF